MDFIEPDSQPQPESEPPQEFVSARARRRRAMRRAYFPVDEDARAALFQHLARRAFPSYELFVFSLVAGVILGVGFLFNAQALLIFGILVAPLLTTWVGMSLALIAGSTRLFIQTMTALFVSSLLIFGSGLLAGVASRALPGSARNFTEAFTHSRLWIPDLIVLAIASIILTISFVRSEDRPYLPSALLAYEIILPICAAGFGLGSGVQGIWPQGALVFLIHFTTASLFCIFTLFFLRFYPITLGGALQTGLAIVAIIAVIVSFTGMGSWIKLQTGLFAPPPVVTLPASSTPTEPSTITPSPVRAESTAIIGVPTQTPSVTSIPTIKSTTRPSATATYTITAEPTPIIGLINASEGGGALIREKPGGKVVAILPNGSIVTIVPNDLQDVRGVIWVHVSATINDQHIEGWLIQSVLVTATPVPDWKPSATSQATVTP